MALIDKRRRTRSVPRSLGAFALLGALALLGGTVGASASIEPAEPVGSVSTARLTDRSGEQGDLLGARRAEPQDEQRFVELINELRRGLGLEPLTVHPTLVPLARDWAVHLRSQGALSHDTDLSVGVSEDWTRLGENVGVGPPGQVQQLFDAFVASPTHYDNLVKPDYRYIGIGVVYGDDGRIWTTHRFMALDTSAATPPAPTPSAPAPPTAPTTPTSPRPTPPSTSRPTTTRPTSTPPTSTPPTTIPPATTPPSTPSTTPPTTIDTSLLEPSRAAVSPGLVERLASDLAAAGL